MNEQKNNPQYQQQYASKGYCEGHFNNIDIVKQLIHVCQEYLSEKFERDIDLSMYHLLCDSDELHKEIHYELTQIIRASYLHKQLVSDNLPLFQAMVGQDIDLQVEPYLRISRPGIYNDNIGLHRDTFYGNTAYEISCIVPLVNFEKGCAVNVLKGSQSLGELSFEQVDHPTITKGSKQNTIGFLYSTKKIKGLNMESLYGPLLQIGDFFMFSLCMVHGQEVNSSQISRWSIDFRFKNSFSPMNVNLKENYYQSFSKSPASVIADIYYARNHNELDQMQGSLPFVKGDS